MNEARTIQELKTLLATPELPSLGREPRKQRHLLSLLKEKLNGLFQDSQLSVNQQQLIRALVLLWHDYLDESHTIAQDIHNADGSFVHGIMHRREPDYSNARYWFHRVGYHPSFPEIAQRAGPILQNVNASSFPEPLIRNGNWDPFAFVDACEHASRNTNPKQIEWLQQLQEVEFQALLDRFLAGE